jgi:hypothetical protein
MEKNGPDGQKNKITEPLGVLLVLAQAALMAAVLHALDMQTSAFRRVVDLGVIGFVIHHLLPLKRRLPFFVILSVTSIIMVMGGTYTRWWDYTVAFPRALAILAFGGALIGMGYLPIGFWKRVGLILTLAGVAALFRSGIFDSAALALIWPVLAAMFMFRLIVYLYDLSTSDPSPPLTRSLAYFFMIPNVSCTLFPVIDFKTFCRSYYNEAPLVIYQRGVYWMGRGLIQLLIYRFIDLHLSLNTTLVASGQDLIQFFLTNSFLYLKVSGLFHLIVGMLLLFGFNLPETNHRYFLASSFTDYWRRVNIYWRDFIMKIFYYPIFFKLKTRPTMALAVATLLSFLATWALHLYQTWWLKGEVTLTGPDALFWAILGLLVLGNALWEMKRGRSRKLASRRYSPAEAARLALQTAGTFACISLLWSLWNSPSVASWLALWRYADGYTVLGGGIVLTVVMTAKIILEVWPAWQKTPALAPAEKRISGELFRRDLVLVSVPLLAILLLAQANAQIPLSPYPVQLVREVLSVGDSKGVDRNQGYYENLFNQDKGNQQLWETFYRMPIQEYTGFSPTRPVPDFRFVEPIPLIQTQAYDTDFRTNRWSMRDRDYPQVKPEGTIRIALLGSSQTLGWGVRQEEIFANLLEDRLNQQVPDSHAKGRFEILNFAFNGYSPLSQVSLMKKRVRVFNPDLVLYVAHTIEFRWAGRDLAKAIHQRVPIPQAFLRGILGDARVGLRTPQVLAQERLQPFETALIAWSYREIVEECRVLGAQPVFVFLPLPYQLPLKPDKAALAVALKTQASEAGFSVIDLTHIFDHQDPRSLLTRRPDEMWTHCNAKAHRQIADWLYRQLTGRSDIDLHGSVPKASAKTSNHSEDSNSFKKGNL